MQMRLEPLVFPFRSVVRIALLMYLKPLMFSRSLFVMTNHQAHKGSRK